MGAFIRIRLGLAWWPRGRRCVAELYSRALSEGSGRELVNYGFSAGGEGIREPELSAD